MRQPSERWAEQEAAGRGPQCFTCGGTGRIDTTSGPLCPSCRGKGYIAISVEPSLTSERWQVKSLEQIIERLEREKVLLHERVEELEKPHGCFWVTKDEYESLKADASQWRNHIAAGDCIVSLKELDALKADAYTYRNIVVKDGGTAKEWLESLQTEVEKYKADAEAYFMLRRRIQCEVTGHGTDAAPLSDNDILDALRFIKQGRDKHKELGGQFISDEEYETLQAKALKYDELASQELTFVPTPRYNELVANEERLQASAADAEKWRLRLGVPDETIWKDSQLGALVRKMPEGYSIRRTIFWVVKGCSSGYWEYRTPEDALRAAGIE